MNDGICDYELCCDGSEEWEGIGGVKCEDRCKEIGKEFRRKDEARQKSLGNAGRKRKELVKEAARLRLQVEDRIKTLHTEIEGQEIKVGQLEQELADVERTERGRVVKSQEGAKGGKLGVLVGLARQRTEELRQSLVDVRGERDDYFGRLEELEKLLATFKEEYNPNFNDEGVKRAVRAWEEYAARDNNGEPSSLVNLDLDEMVKGDKENGIDWEEYEAEGEGEENDTDVRKYCQPGAPIPLLARTSRTNCNNSIRLRKLPPTHPPRLARPQTPRPAPPPHRLWHPRLQVL